MEMYTSLYKCACVCHGGLSFFFLFFFFAAHHLSYVPPHPCVPSLSLHHLSAPGCQWSALCILIGCGRTARCRALFQLADKGRQVAEEPREKEGDAL